LEEAAPYLDSKYKEYGRWGQDKVLPGSENFQIDFSQLLQDRFIIGSPEHCINEIERLKQLGVGIATFRMSWAGMPVELSLKSMKLLAEQVIPRFR
jgi:alkanesulfonate monooxygenase SsuD/methylene tetrahydromethanopterin reductase-like flavin-dependent oxidoreductase (luciferase family)